MIETFLMVLPLFHVREHMETCDVLRRLEVLRASLCLTFTFGFSVVCVWTCVYGRVCVCVCVCVCWGLSSWLTCLPGAFVA